VQQAFFITGTRRERACPTLAGRKIPGFTSASVIGQAMYSSVAKRQAKTANDISTKRRPREAPYPGRPPHLVPRSVPEGLDSPCRDEPPTGLSRSTHHMEPSASARMRFEPHDLHKAKYLQNSSPAKLRAKSLRSVRFKLCPSEPQAGLAMACMYFWPLPGRPHGLCCVHAPQGFHGAHYRAFSRGTPHHPMKMPICWHGPVAGAGNSLEWAPLLGSTNLSALSLVGARQAQTG